MSALHRLHSHLGQSAHTFVGGSSMQVYPVIDVTYTPILHIDKPKKHKLTEKRRHINRGFLTRPGNQLPDLKLLKSSYKTQPTVACQSSFEARQLSLAQRFKFLQQMAPNMKYWDDWADVEDMDAMWNHPDVRQEWLMAGEECGMKVHMSRNIDGKPYVTLIEMKVCRIWK